MPYAIRLPDGTLVNNIPDEITPQQAKQRIIERRPELLGRAPAESGFFENIGTLAVEGGKKALTAAKVGPSVIAGTTGPEQAAAIAGQLGAKPVKQPKELIEAQQAFKEEGEAFAKAQGFKESIGPVVDMLAEFGKQVITNPKGAAYLTAESAAYMIPAIIGGITFGKAGLMAAGPPGAVVGGMGGMFAGQAPVEAGSEFVSIVQKELANRKMPPTEENVRAILADKAFVESAISDARTKGLTTAGVDAVTTMIGGRFATGAKRAAAATAMRELGAAADAAQVAKRATEILEQRTLLQKTGRIAGGVGIDVAGGGASEAAGQAAAYGEVDLADVGLEMLGELGGTAAEIPSVAYATAEKKIKGKPAEEQPPVLPAAESRGKPQSVETFPEERPAPQAPGVISSDEIDRVTANYPVGIRETVRRQLSGRSMDDLRAMVEDDPEILQNESLGAQAIRTLLGLQPGREAERPPAEPSVGVPSGVAGQPGVTEPTPPQRVEAPQPSGVVSGEPATGVQPPVERPIAPTVTETPSGITPPEAEQAAPQGAQPEAVGTTEPGAEAGAAPAPVETAGVAQTWTEMDRAQREQMAARAGLKKIPAAEVSAKPWSRLTKDQKDAIAGVMQVEPAPLAEVPEATAEPEQMPIPAPEMPQEQAALEAAERERRRILRAPGANLRTALMGTLPPEEVRDISPDLSMRPLQARAGKAPTSLSTLVADGQLNEFLPPNMRNDSSTFDETDSVEYIKERLRNKNHYTFDTNFALEQIGLQIAEIEAAMREHLTLRETNLLIQEAADEQRRIDEEVETATAQAAPGTAAAAPAVAPAPELTAEEEARLEREAIQAESEEAASRLSPTTPASLKAAEDRAKAAEKEAEQARKDAAKAEAEAKKERERREIAEASIKAAEDFQLGQSAEDNLSGQRDLLQQEESKVTEARTAQGGWSIDPEEQRIEKELTGKTFDQLTDWAVDNAPDAYAKEIAQKVQKRLREFAKAGVQLNFQLETGTTRSTRMFGARGRVLRIASKNKPVELTLFLNGAASIENQNGYPPGMRYSTVLHELIHAATELYIEMAPNSPQVRALNDLRNKVVKYYNDRVKAGNLTEFEQNIFNRTTNSLENVDEVLAWGLTDRDMQQFLADVKVGDRSLFDRFVDIVRNILGLDRPYKSALEELIRTADSLLEITTEQIEKDVTARGYLFGPPNGPTLSQVAAPMSQGELFQQEAKSIWGGEVGKSFTVDNNINWFEKYVMVPLVNRNYDIQNVYKSIKKAGIDIQQRFDIEELEKTASGMEWDMERAFLQDEVDPILKEMRDNKIEMEDLHNYMLALHAEERNREVARRNSKMPDGGSGMTNQEAKDYVDSLSPDQKKKLDSVANKVYAIQNVTREIILKTGQEPAKRVNAWTKMFKNYVPLFREEMEYDDNKLPGQGTGASVRGDFSRKFAGSSKPVQDVFASVVMQRQRAISRGMKMRMGRGVFGLALTAPNPDLWMAVDPRSTKMVQVQRYNEELSTIQSELLAGVADAEREQMLTKRVDILQDRIKNLTPIATKELSDLIGNLASYGFSGEEIRNLMAQPFEAVYSPTSGMVEYKPNKLLKSPYVIFTRINGEEVFVFFNKQNERGRRMAEQLNGLGTEPLSLFNRIIQPLTRWFAAINTQYNPLWGIYNFLRDTQTAAIQASGTVIEGSRMKVVADAWRMAPQIYKMLRDERDGKKNNSEVAKAFREMRAQGGTTGFTDNFSRQEDRVKALADEMKKFKEGKIKSFGRNNIFGIVSDFNTMLENTIRLAAYMEAKSKYKKQYMDQGMSESLAEIRSVQPSAVVAKEITVNFNQKGALSSKVGSMFAFFNAAVQGTARAAQALFTWDKPGDWKSFRMTPFGKKFIAGALMWGAMQPLLLAMFGIDDDDIEEFQKERNFIIPIGEGKVFMFPMPFVFSAIPNTSRLMTEFFMSDMKNPGKYLGNLASAYINAFNPLGGTLGVQTFTPTAFKPIIALATNEDAFGRKISKEEFDERQQTPGYQMAKDSATAFGKVISEFMNYVSGGTKDVAGKLSPTPDQVDYFAGQLTGGIGRELMKVQQVAAGAITGEDAPFYKYPLIGRFMLDVKEGGAISNKFYDNIIKMNAYENTIKGMQARRESIGEYMKENPEARLWRQAGIVERDIQNLRKTMKAAKEKGDKERVQRIQEQIKVRMQRFNEQVKELES